MLQNACGQLGSCDTPSNIPLMRSTTNHPFWHARPPNIPFTRFRQQASAPIICCSPLAVCRVTAHCALGKLRSSGRPSQVDLFKEELLSGIQDASNTSDERTRQINEMIGSLERAVGEAQVCATEVREHSGAREGSLGDVGGCFGMFWDVLGCFGMF